MVVSPPCRGRHRFVSGNVRVAWQAGGGASRRWADLRGLHARGGWRRGRLRDLLAPGVAHNRSAGCGCTAPSASRLRHSGTWPGAVARPGRHRIPRDPWVWSDGCKGDEDRDVARPVGWTGSRQGEQLTAQGLGITERGWPQIGQGGRERPDAIVDDLPAPFDQAVREEDQGRSRLKDQLRLGAGAVGSDAEGRFGGVTSVLTRPSPSTSTGGG